jgi:hypothetical protein
MAKLLEHLAISCTALLRKRSIGTGGLDLIRVWLKSRGALILEIELMSRKRLRDN